MNKKYFIFILVLMCLTYKVASIYYETKGIKNDDADNKDNIVSRTVDLDADNKPERIDLYKKDGKNKVRIWTGTGKVLEKNVLKDSKGNKSDIQLMDLNRDGVPEIILGNDSNDSKNISNFRYEILDYANRLKTFKFTVLFERDYITCKLLSSNIISISIKGIKDYQFKLGNGYEVRDYEKYKLFYYNGNKLTVNEGQDTFVYGKVLRDNQLDLSMAIMITYKYDINGFKPSHIKITNNGDLLVDQDIG
ncbi:hypothetical protein PV797_02210 [Clostridiaceae bacterium M8S5]|nr:hypothetical protein PV797_02210 [Clostridiaceae bacterium M8S5]